MFSFRYILPRAVYPMLLLLVFSFIPCWTTTIFYQTSIVVANFSIPENKIVRNDGTRCSYSTNNKLNIFRSVEGLLVQRNLCSSLSSLIYHSVVFERNTKLRVLFCDPIIISKNVPYNVLILLYGKVGF